MFTSYPQTPPCPFLITPCSSGLARNPAACTCRLTISCALSPNNRGIVPSAYSSPDQARTEPLASRRFRATGALPSPRTRLQQNIPICPQALWLQAALTTFFLQNPSPVSLRALLVTLILLTTTPPSHPTSPPRRTPG